MTSLPAGPLPFDTAFAYSSPRDRRPSSLSSRVSRHWASTFSSGLFLPAVASFSADSEFGFKVNVRDACQLLRQLSTLLCFEC
jgi:hypothetical protein